MKTLKYLLYKEFAQILRNKTTLRMIIFMPIFQLLILPIALTFEQKDIALSVVDNDKSSLSREIVRKITSNSYFHLADYSSNYEQAMRKMDENKADLILEIPAHLEKDFVRREQPKVLITINSMNGMKGSIVLSYVMQILQSFNIELAEKFVSVGGIELKPHYRYNPSMSYSRYMVPGILVILMSLIGGMLASVNIVREKEIGTIEQINVTPVSKPIFILAKLVPFWIIGMVVLTTGLLVAWLVYGLFPWQNFLNIYLFSVCYLIAFSGFGIIISNYSDTQQQAILTIFFFFMNFILLSGLFTSISSMPRWTQILTIFNPVRYFVESMRMMFLKGSTFMDILPNLLKILVFAVVFNGGAILSYRKTG
ncbi:MAG: ABC transporter permease [Flavobacteriaceae bacterium]|jgi:ABC-2 type transport system permease protein|nr:ABC transporter permease [Flavobacteriaceae bacterium]